MQVTDLAQTAPSVWGMDPKIVATAIVVVCYAILFTEKLNRAVVALLGAALMIFSGILTQETALQGIDFNTISLLVGMMTIVGISEKSGMFQFVAVWGAKKVRANPRGLLIVLAFVTAVFSAFLDNVTTVLLIAPVTMIVLVFGFDLIWHKSLLTTEKNKQAVMRISEKDTITDWKLLGKSLFVLALVIAGFISAEHIHIANGTIAIAGAAVLLLLYTFGNRHDERERKVEEAFNLIDWTTIFFFSGLFVIVYGLEETGILRMLGQKFIELTDGSIQKSTMLIVWISAILSSAIDNIPFVATMIPMIKSMEASMGGREAMMPVWWALSLGACFGGNGTLIGASANVVVAGMAMREGHPIKFLGFLIWSVPVMLLSVGIATVFLYLEYQM